MREKKMLYQDGKRYILMEDPKLVQERKERRGYSKGVEDGEAMAVWKPPTSKDTPLPSINYQKLGKLYDVNSYRKGFADGYYKFI
jgi:hypothetical protein